MNFRKNVKHTGGEPNCISNMAISETEYLKKKDKAFGEVIEKIGHIEREVDSDLFSSVIHHIIGPADINKGAGDISGGV